MWKTKFSGIFRNRLTNGRTSFSDAIDLLIQSGRTIDAIPLDGWRIDVGYPDDREEAEARLDGEFEEGAAAANSTD